MRDYSAGYRAIVASLSRDVSYFGNQLPKFLPLVSSRYFSISKFAASRLCSKAVTGSRLHAVCYKQQMDKYIREKGYTDVKTLLAFSGEVIDPDIADKKSTEVGMNNSIREIEMPEKFASEEYQVLIVAERYQMGFDQPKPYYGDTEIGEMPDIQPYAIQHEPEATPVIRKAEITASCETWFRNRREPFGEHKQLNGILDQAVERLKPLTDEDKDAFKSKLVSFRKGFRLEKICTYARFLLLKFARRSSAPGYDIEDEIALRFYRLQKNQRRQH
jgi:type I restriction enzyme R subunit